MDFSKRLSDTNGYATEIRRCHQDSTFSVTETEQRHLTPSQRNFKLFSKCWIHNGADCLIDDRKMGGSG
ncbi:hypothetical protein TSUD_131130 [Trifolium subterraneum]|uniref:Uncharacterized protein n=1 Tax=Trifolium subterraneum TaxID=3900 RepID=A0A2Z6P382_TRISU|nr:hypothetical protein TSUD_131130 [Trifolium subterraneum]